MARPPSNPAGSQWGGVIGLLLALVSCGGSSPTEVADADAVDATDAAFGDRALEPEKDAAIRDRALKPELDSGPPLGRFFCADLASYFVEVKTVDGQEFRLVGPCNDTPTDQPDFGVARGAVIVSGTTNLYVCATHESGASISFFGLLTNYRGGTGTASGRWSNGLAPDAAAINVEGTIDVTRVGSLGDTMEGTYALTSSSVALSGAFRVCHVFDYVFPPPP